MDDTQIKRFLDTVTGKKIRWSEWDLSGTIDYFIPNGNIVATDKGPSMRGDIHMMDGSVNFHCSVLVADGFDFNGIHNGQWYFISDSKSDATRCCCGSDSVGSPKHSYYCPKYNSNQ